MSNPVDDLITAITEAPTEDAAMAIMARVPALTVAAMADQLYIEGTFQGIKSLRKQCVREARA
jgi:hypothetical protein